MAAHHNMKECAASVATYASSSSSLLSVSQSSNPQFERSDDMRLSTLENYIKALGGRLEIRAIFDDETVPIG